MERPAQAMRAEAWRENPGLFPRRDGERTISSEAHESMPPRKAAIVYAAPVPQTDTGGWGGNPKAGGGSIVKELGKMAP